MYELRGGFLGSILSSTSRQIVGNKSADFPLILATPDSLFSPDHTRTVHVLKSFLTERLIGPISCTSQISQILLLQYY